MRSPRALTVLAGALVALLAGCVPSVLNEAGPPPTRTRASSAQLVAARTAAGIAGCPASSALPAVEGGLPDLTLECLGGDTTVRLGGLRGPMLVNLWAQWCEPCRAESGHLAAFAGEQDEVTVLGVNYTDPQPALAIEFAGLTGLTFPHVADEEHELRAPLGIVGIPYSLLVGADGRILARHPGPFDSLPDLRSWVEEGLRR